MFAFKPDLDQTMQRMEAFWQHDVLERPVTLITLEKPVDEQVPLPESHHSTTAERWLDVEYQAQLADAKIANRIFLGDSLPITYPNLGPEVLAAFYGCPLIFGDYGTSWTEPILKDWDRADEISLDWQNPYLLTLSRLTDAMLALAEGNYVVGMPDWHPGGDLLAALRNPQDLAVDLIERPEQITALLKRLQPDYYAIYTTWYEKLNNGQPITSWLGLASYSKYYIPSNDFSALISNKMYREFFLDGIVDECRFLDRSIYHLDGPNALRHLETILTIPELHAVQWVPGAGREGFSKWVWVYQKIQAAGKSMIAYCEVSDLELLMQTLSPRGLAIEISGVSNVETGENILSSLEKWTQEDSS
jgi:hypothetical protein